MAEEVLRAKVERHLVQFAPTGTEPALRLLGAARLQGWQITAGLFSATGGHRVVDIVPADDAREVWARSSCFQWSLSAAAMVTDPVLDRVKGHRMSRDPETHVPERVTVDFSGDAVEAWTYVGCVDARERCAREHQDARLSPHYVDAIMTGARKLAIPDQYLSELRELLAAHA